MLGNKKFKDKITISLPANGEPTISYTLLISVALTEERERVDLSIFFGKICHVLHLLIQVRKWK